MEPSLRRSTGLASEPVTEYLVESRDATIDLSSDGQRELAAVGQRLARGTTRFGEVDPESTASLVSCIPLGGTKCRVRVRNAVGVLAIPGARLEVAPKIPQQHLLYLLERANLVPAIDRAPTEVDLADALYPLIARWFVNAIERTLRDGLARDYRPKTDLLSSVRGRIHPLPTARRFYRGDLSVMVDYEEFDFDTSLNRILRHGATLVVASPALPKELRRRARRAVAQMEDAGPLRHLDLAATWDRRTAHYADALTLARQLISGEGRSLSGVGRRAWSFLIPTPKPLQEAITTLLRTRLRPLWVGPRKLPLAPSKHTLNPDVVFGSDQALADVKYKLADPDWERADLYEVVAFATGFGIDRAAVLGFARPGSKSPGDLQVGGVSVKYIPWVADPEVDPDESATNFSDAVAGWLGVAAAHSFDTPAPAATGVVGSGTAA